MTSDAPRSVLFLDNGGDVIKALYIAASGADGTLTADAAAAAAAAATPRWLVVPNCVGAASYAGRGIVGEQIHMLPHYHGFMVRRPVARGFIVDGLLQAHIWEHILQHFGIDVDEHVELWLTLPHGAPRGVASLLNVLVTQRFHFHSLTCVSSSFLALLACEYAMRHGAATRSATALATHDHHPPPLREGCALVVDVGFSSTTVVPYVDYLPVYSSIVRTDVGGKVLTNRLKEHLSFTQVNVMEDGWLVNYIKEQCCSVSLRPRAMLADYEHAAETTRVATTMMAVGTATAYATRAPDARNVVVDGKKSGRLRGDAADYVYFYLPTVPALYPLGCVGHESAAVRLGLWSDKDPCVKKCSCSTTTSSSSSSRSSETDNGGTTCGKGGVVLTADKPLHCPRNGEGARGASTSSDEDAGDEDDESGSDGCTAASQRKSCTATFDARQCRTLTAAARETLARMQSIQLGHVRFLVPELLFTPGDVGSKQLGVAEAVTHGVFERGLLRHLPLLRQAMLSRVFVYGGSSNFTHFLQRLTDSVRAELTEHATATHDRSDEACVPHAITLAYALRTQSRVAASTVADTEHAPTCTTHEQAQLAGTRGGTQHNAAPWCQASTHSRSDTVREHSEYDDALGTQTRKLAEATHVREDGRQSMPMGQATAAQLLPLYGAELLLTRSELHEQRERVCQQSRIVFRYTRVTRAYETDIQTLLQNML